ncbi:MAG: hypothetical protein LQ350_002539 [Teloschistes chrysophthalmus]|nr:MAG: hypothetical protein LQ350_002539 [Niorma chrysophthalma]
MEPPYKRRRLLEPTETDAELTEPDAELYKKRTRNTLKLKSRFESIFDKYGKDFGDAADEIDMETGEITVDNGHVWNMLGETDVSLVDQEKGHPSSGRKQQPLRDDSIEEHYKSIIPDSQDFESDDGEDPLTTLTSVIRNTASRIRNDMANSTLQSESFRRHHQQPHQMWSSSPSIQASAPAAFARPTPRLRLVNGFPTEEAWRAPPLPGDDDPQLGLPSPQPSDIDDDGASRSASPPGISLWALPKERRPRLNAQETSKPTRRKNASRASSAMWTQEEDDSLRDLRNQTTLHFDELCDHFSGRTSNALQCRWEVLCGKKEPATDSPRANLWTLEEETLLRQSRLFTNKTWREIQAEMPGRSFGAIQFHWHKLQQREKNGRSPPHAGHPLNDSVELPTPVMPSQKGASNPKFSSPNTELLSPPHLSNPTANRDGDVDSSLAVIGAVESDEMLSRNSSPVQKDFPSDVVIPDSQSCMGTQQSVEQQSAMPSSLQGGMQLAEPAPEESIVIHDSQETTVPVSSNLSENRDTLRIHQSELAPIVREPYTTRQRTRLSAKVHDMAEVIDLTLDDDGDDDEDDGSSLCVSTESSGQHATSVSLGDGTHPVPSEKRYIAATEVFDHGKERMVGVPATSQVFKQIEIRKPSPAAEEAPTVNPLSPRDPSSAAEVVPTVKSLRPGESMKPPETTATSPRPTVPTPIKIMTPSSTRAKVIRVTSLTPQQSSERIAPFTLLLPNGDGVPIGRGKLLFPKISTPPRPATIPQAVNSDIAPLSEDDDSRRKEVDFHVPSSEAVIESQNSVANLEDDEDDLHVSTTTKPAPASHPSNSRRHSYDSLRPRIQDADVSDDELSLPVRPELQRVAMTPVRSLPTERRLTSLLSRAA